MKHALDEELYKNQPINNLILFCLYALNEKKKERSFENIVKECFTLFPKTFSFKNFPKWPDSRKLDRPLRTLRNKKLITGDPQTKFSLTKKGRKRALEIIKALKQKKLL